MWQHVQLSERICPWDTLASCLDGRQPTDNCGSDLVSVLCMLDRICWYWSTDWHLTSPSRLHSYHYNHLSGLQHPSYVLFFPNTFFPLDKSHFICSLSLLCFSLNVTEVKVSIRGHVLSADVSLWTLSYTHPLQFLSACVIPLCSCTSAGCVGLSFQSVWRCWQIGRKIPKISEVLCRRFSMRASFKENKYLWRKTVPWSICISKYFSFVPPEPGQPMASGYLQGFCTPATTMHTFGQCENRIGQKKSSTWQMASFTVFTLWT